MNNIDHITFVNSILKVTASETLNIEDDLKKDQTQSISSLINNKNMNEKENTKEKIIQEENHI